MIWKCSTGGEAHSVTMDLLRSLSNLLMGRQGSNHLRSIRHQLRGVLAGRAAPQQEPTREAHCNSQGSPYVMEHADRLEKKFEAVLGLLISVLNVIHCLIDFKELPSAYISQDAPQVIAATAHIPITVYWVIRSLLACASTLLNLIGSSHEYITSTVESWDILSLAHKLSVILEHLREQLAVCKGLVERKKAEDAYIAFKRLVESSHIDNMKILRAMIRAREDQRPLYDDTKRINARKA